MAKSTIDIVERILKLSTADLPQAPFRLNRWTEIQDPTRFLELLQARIRNRQEEATVSDSTLEADMIELSAIVNRG